MTFEPYDWQKRLLKRYNGSGVVKAFAGTGKTYATILLIKDRNFKNVLVGVPTKKLKKQWIEELIKHDVIEAQVEFLKIYMRTSNLIK